MLRNLSEVYLLWFIYCEHVHVHVCVYARVCVVCVCACVCACTLVHYVKLFLLNINCPSELHILCTKLVYYLPFCLEVNVKHNFVII